MMFDDPFIVTESEKRRHHILGIVCLVLFLAASSLVAAHYVFDAIAPHE